MKTTTSKRAASQPKRSSETSPNTRASERLKQEVDDLQSTLARFVRENDTFRRTASKFYERTRMLENNIRKHAEGQCNCKTPQACLLELGKKVPKLPRKIYKRRHS